MTDSDDIDPVSQTLVSIQAAAFLLAVYSLSAALDVTDLLVAPVNPQSVAKFACSIWPLAMVPVSSVLGLSPQLISDLCLGEVREPAISLVFFSIKLTMAFLAFAVLWVFVCWRPDDFRALRDAYWQRFKAPEGYRKEFKSFCGNSLGVIFFLSCCLLLASIFASKPGDSFVLILKFILEDGLAVAIPAVALNISARALLFISFACVQRNSATGHDR